MPLSINKKKNPLKCIIAVICVTTVFFSSNLFAVTYPRGTVGFLSAFPITIDQINQPILEGRFIFTGLGTPAMVVMYDNNGQNLGSWDIQNFSSWCIDEGATGSGNISFYVPEFGILVTFSRIVGRMHLGNTNDYDWWRTLVNPINTSQIFYSEHVGSNDSPPSTLCIDY